MGYGPLDDPEPFSVAPRPATDRPAVPPGDVIVKLDDGRELPMKKTICIPHGNKKVPAGPREKLTAKLREKADTADYLICRAAEKGRVENMKMCISEGANVNCRNGCGGATPLICAAVAGHVDVTKMLIEAGADPLLGNLSADTPLLIAAYWDHMPLVRYYLETLKLDPRVANNQDIPETPLDRADRNQNKQMQDLIEKCWATHQAEDDKKHARLMKTKETQQQIHRARVSREAEERRAAAAVAVA